MLKVFSIFDEKALGYLIPFFSVNRGVAVRTVMRAVQDSGSELSRFSSDYVLYELGEWDPKTAEFFPNSEPFLVGRLSEYKESE